MALWVQKFVFRLPLTSKGKKVEIYRGEIASVNHRRGEVAILCTPSVRVYYGSEFRTATILTAKQEAYRNPVVKGSEIEFARFTAFQEYYLGDQVVFSITVTRKGFIDVDKFALLTRWVKCEGVVERKRKAARTKTPEIKRPEHRKRYGRDKFSRRRK